MLTFDAGKLAKDDDAETQKLLKELDSEDADTAKKAEVQKDEPKKEAPKREEPKPDAPQK
jgi:hypothetical protein